MPQRKLFDKATLERLKKHPLYSQDGKGDDAVVEARIFNPYGMGVWYLTEYDGDDTLYGYYKDSDNDEDGEYGYVSKSEMENTKVRVFGTSLPLERDQYFKTTTLGKVNNHGTRSTSSNAAASPTVGESNFSGARDESVSGVETSSKAKEG